MRAKREDTKLIVAPKKGFEIDSKRFQFPLKITTKCPECGEPCKADYSTDDHVSSPTLGKPTVTYWLCPNYHEFTISLVFSLSVKLAE